MKANHILLMLFAFTLIVGTSCRRPPKSTSLNYEVRPMEQGKQGTVLFKIYSYGFNSRQAVDRAKMDAVHAVLFKGIPGSNSEKPLVDANTLEKNKAYFVNFFGGEDEINQYTIGQIRTKEGSRQGPYRIYVTESGDGSVEDRAKVNGMVKVGIPVTVNIDGLRRQLETDGIIRKFGL